MPAATQGIDDADKELSPHADPQREQTDLKFPSYIIPRRLGAVYANLPVKPVTTLITPRIPVGILC